MMKDNNLFRFEVFVNSKQLGDALALLSGRVAQITPPQLVANAKANGHGLANMSRTEIVGMFAEYLRKNKLRQFTAANTKAFLTSIGRSPGSSSYLQTQAKEHGLIKNIGENATTSKWQVLAAKSKPKRKTAKKTAVAS